MSYRRELYFGVSIIFLIIFVFYCYTSFCTSVLILTEEDLFNLTKQFGQDDQILLNYIRKHHIFGPPPLSAQRKLENPVNTVFNIPNDDLSNGNLLRLLQNKTRGFFVECGANDGEFLSNSIGLEVLKGWTGLLIEASPTYFAKLKTKNRNAWLSDACLSGSHPEKLEFMKHKIEVAWAVGNGRIKPVGEYKEPPLLKGTEKNYNSEGILDCFPLYSVLSAINVTHVDFFSLDVEGHEYQILKGIPFDRLSIDVIFVEYILAPEGKQALMDLLISKGYVLVFEGLTDFVFSKI